MLLRTLHLLSLCERWMLMCVLSWRATGISSHICSWQCRAWNQMWQGSWCHRNWQLPQIRTSFLPLIPQNTSNWRLTSTPLVSRDDRALWERKHTQVMLTFLSFFSATGMTTLNTHVISGAIAATSQPWAKSESERFFLWHPWAIESRAAINYLQILY